MQTQHNHLLRVLGLVFGLAAVVGSVVGQGILRSPGIVAQASGSPAVLIGLWALGPALSLLAALPFAELGAAIPRAGGAIAYAEREGYAYVVEEPTPRRLQIQAYADNFKYDRVGRWTH